MIHRVVAAAVAFAGVDAQMLFSPPVDPKVLKKELAASNSSKRVRSTVKGAASLSNPTLCDSSVKQHSGYLNVAEGTDYFFWMFESRNNPSTDPVVMWLSGGPGCSSQLAALGENGPCNIGTDGSVNRNDYGWNSNANLIYVDQPTGTGFSTGEATISDENGVKENMYQFMQEFYKALPQYKSNDFFLFGESYAGHYVPAVSHYIWQQGKQSDDFKVPLKGFGVGNGLTDPGEQFKWYPEMAENGGSAEGGSLQQGVITDEDALSQMRQAAQECIGEISSCNQGSEDGCYSAYSTCNQGEIGPYAQTGMNPYDMRIRCEKPPLCYDFDAVGDFLNAEDTQRQLGVSTQWQSCNMQVNRNMQGDYMRNYHTLIPDMLADGVQALIYAGDVDYICNWLGNKHWTLAMEWPHKDDFNAAADEEFSVQGQTAGRIRKSHGMHFMQIYQAGHLVPRDQPAVALNMLNGFTSNQLGGFNSAASLVV